MSFDEQYKMTFTRDWSRFEKQLQPEHCSQLEKQGYTIIDEFLGHGWASAILQEMEWLHKKNHMLPNKTQFSLPDGRAFQFSKPNIFEVDLHDSATRSLVPELDALFHQTAWVRALCAGLPNLGLGLQEGTQAHTLKLQRNAGNGACFPCHYDNPGRPNRRALSCLLYLNEGWREEDGGHLRLMPFLGRAETVSPVMDRMVIFRSDRVLHRVLPCHRERYCLTIWLDGSGVNLPEDSALRVSKSQLDDWLGFVDMLHKSPVQRLLSRGVYEEEYAESLKECMGDVEGYQEMLEAHQAQVVALGQNPALHALVQKLRRTKALQELTM